MQTDLLVNQNGSLIGVMLSLLFSFKSLIIVLSKTCDWTKVLFVLGQIFVSLFSSLSFFLSVLPLSVVIVL